jgi:hypothetical protein
MAGKGDRARPVNKKQFDKNYERIFGKGKSKQEGETCSQHTMRKWHKSF